MIECIMSKRLQYDDDTATKKKENRIEHMRIVSILGFSNREFPLYSIHCGIYLSISSFIRIICDQVSRTKKGN